MKNEFSKQDREIISSRSEGVCEVCRQERATQIHHRRPRGRFGLIEGTNTPANGLHLGNSCHHWIEHNRTQAKDLGQLLVNTQNPEEEPVKFYDGWFLLHVDGSREAVTPQWV